MIIRGFDDAFELLIGHEGGYSNNPADPGAETMWGITAKVARDNGYKGEMRSLPLSEAKRIAKTEYWDDCQCDQLAPEIAFQIFDAAYNSGPVTAAQWVQRAVGVNPDGLIGAKTIAAVRDMSQAQFGLRFNALRLQYLAKLQHWPAFGRGWCNRIALNLVEAAD